MRKRALDALDLRRGKDLLLFYPPTCDEKLIEKMTGIKVEGGNQKEKMKLIFDAFDVDLYCQLGVNLEVIWSNRKPRLIEGSFEELKEDFPFTDAFHIAYKNLGNHYSTSLRQG